MREVIKAVHAYEKRAKQLAHMLVQDRMEISTALREARKKKKMGLRELARKLGISAAFLSDVELGRRGVSSSLLEKLKTLK